MRVIDCNQLFRAPFLSGQLPISPSPSPLPPITPSLPDSARFNSIQTDSIPFNQRNLNRVEGGCCVGEGGGEGREGGRGIRCPMKGRDDMGRVSARTAGGGVDGGRAVGRPVEE